MAYTVGEVARLSGVTVRTLHHYDDIGLLSPTGRSAGGYRLYSNDDLQRLQQVRVYRELGFGLDRIALLLAEDGDVLVHLRRQHGLLVAERGRLDTLVATLERTMEARRMGINLDPAELFEVFGDDDPTEHATEAEERWGDTDTYGQSQRRSASYTKADWLRMKADLDEVEQRFADLMAAGVEVGSTDARAAVEAHRAHINTWFYDCSPELQCALAEMYVADARFAEHYNRRAPGLATYVHDAIVASASA